MPNFAFLFDFMKLIQLSFYLVALLFLLACESSEKQTSNDVQKSTTLVEVIVVEEGILNEKIQSTGTLAANESTQLSADIGGIIKKISFKEGQKVKQGDLLLELRNNDLSADLEEARARKDLSKKQFERAQKLLEAEGISRELLEEREANMKELSANYQMIEAELAKTKVYAPFDGIIGLRSVSQGDYLAAGTSFTNLVDGASLKIEFSLPEKYLQAVKIGDTIEFNSGSNSSMKLAVIYAIDPAIDVNSRSFHLKAIYSNTDGTLKSGAFVTVYCELKHYENAISIPTQAIVPEMEGKFVYLVENKKAKKQEVVTGVRKANHIQILEGLQKGDTVVISGLLQIRDGSLLQIRMDIRANPKSQAAE